MSRFDGVPKKPVPGKYERAAAVSYFLAEMQRTNAEMYMALHKVLQNAEEAARLQGAGEDAVFAGYDAVEALILDSYPDLVPTLDSMYAKGSMRRHQRAVDAVTPEPRPMVDTVGTEPVQHTRQQAQGSGEAAQLDAVTRDRAVAGNLLLAHLQKTGHPAYEELADLMKAGREGMGHLGVRGTAAHVAGHIAVERAIRAQHPDLIPLLENSTRPAARPETRTLDPEVEKRNTELTPSEAQNAAKISDAIQALGAELWDSGEKVVVERIVDVRNTARQIAKERGLNPANQTIDGNTAVAQLLNAEYPNHFARVKEILEKN